MPVLIGTIYVSTNVRLIQSSFLKKDFIYLFLERREGREKERERNIDWLLLVCAPTRTKSKTQACALSRD